MYTSYKFKSPGQSVDPGFFLTQTITKMRTITKTLVLILLFSNLLLKSNQLKAENQEAKSFSVNSLNWETVGLAVGLIIALQVVLSLRTSSQIADLKREVCAVNATQKEEAKAPSLESLINHNNVTWTSNKIRSNEKADTYVFIAEVGKSMPAVNVTDNQTTPSKNTKSSSLLLWIGALVVWVMLVVIW